MAIEKLKICKGCGKEYFPSPKHRNRSKFCSLECYKNTPKTEEFKKKLSIYHKGKPKIFNRKENRVYPDSRIEKECGECGKKIKVYQSKIKHYKNTFCSTKCRLAYLKRLVSGKNNYRWNGGFCKYNGSVWKKISKQIKERDKYICQSCFEKLKSEDLIVHHRIQKKKGGLDIPANLIALCKSCHMRIHNLYYSKENEKTEVILTNGW